MADPGEFGWCWWAVRYAMFAVAGMLAGGVVSYWLAERAGL